MGKMSRKKWRSFGGGKKECARCVEKEITRIEQADEERLGAAIPLLRLRRKHYRIEEISTNAGKGGRVCSV